jgi:hypothetical protein
MSVIATCDGSRRTKHAHREVLAILPLAAADDVNVETSHRRQARKELQHGVIGRSFAIHEDPHGGAVERW